MIGDARKQLSQPIFLDAETESFLQHLGRLLEDEDFETLANTADVGRRSADRQRGFADNENIIRRKIGVRWNLPRADADRFQQPCSLAFRIEQTHFSDPWRR